MPKYVFEVAITLSAGDDLTMDQCNRINAELAHRLEMMALVFQKRGGRISAEPPFEQVTGDWLPADENGVIKLNPETRPIDHVTGGDHDTA